MDEDEQWHELILSMQKAAKILNIELTERDMPEYLDWFAGRNLHQDLWDRVYLRNANRRRS